MAVGGSAQPGVPNVVWWRMARPPKARAAPPPIAAMPAGAPASGVIATALPPAARISAVTASARPPSRSATATRAPHAAKPSAVARPIPDPAPDTSATLPSNRMEASTSEIAIAAGELLEDGAPEGLAGAVADVDDAQRVVR